MTNVALGGAEPVTKPAPVTRPMSQQGIPEGPYSRIFRANIVDGLLQVELMPGVTSGASYGEVSVGVRSIGNPPGSRAIKITRTFPRDDPSLKKGRASIQPMIQSTPETVELDWMDTSSSPFRIVRLTSSTGRPPAPGFTPIVRGVSLNVSIPDAVGGFGSVWGEMHPSKLVLALHASSLEKFVKENPREVEQYIRPMFDELQLDYLLISTEVELYQVLPEAIDPEINRNIHPLLTKLDSDSPDERRKAEADLYAMGPMAAVELTRLDPATLSPEQQTRIAAIGHSIHLLSREEIASRRHDPAFLAQGLVNEDRRLRVAALAVLQEVLGRNIEFNIDADITARNNAMRALHLPVAPSATQP
jgi:hypothetical protein